MKQGMYHPLAATAGAFPAGQFVEHTFGHKLKFRRIEEEIKNPQSDENYSKYAIFYTAFQDPTHNMIGI